MYNGTVTRADTMCVNSWDMDGGLKAYVVIDESPESPFEWDTFDAGSFAAVEHRNGWSIDACQGSNVPTGLREAMEQWSPTRDMEKITRYLSIFHDAAAVVSRRVSDYTVIGVVTRAEMISAGIGNTADEYLTGGIKTYADWADGRVYGVIVTNPANGREESLWGIYDDDDGAYIKSVADELAFEVADDPGIVSEREARKARGTEGWDGEPADDGGIFSLTVGWDNAAFADGNAGAELARILRTVADRLESGDTAGTVKDYNGNTCGKFDLS